MAKWCFPSNRGCFQIQKSINVINHINKFKKKKVKVLVTQLCLILCNPMGCSPSGSSVYKIFQARTLEWVAISCSSA